MTKRIAIIVEGATEEAFAKVLREYLSRTLSGRMPKLKFITEDGRIPTGDRLKRDAKQKMRAWVGAEPRFHPHAAQYEFEAWLLPYWTRIQTLAGSNRNSPSPQPETVDHDNPPARHLGEVFRTGTKNRAYSKTRDGAAILRDQDLEVAAASCPELRAFLDTILSASGKPL